MEGKTLIEVLGEEADRLPADALTEIDLEQSAVSMAYRKPSYPLTVCIPYVGTFPGIVVASLLYYAKHMDIGFELQGNSLLMKARNDLAMRFLRSNAQWSFWLDSDVFMPFGNPAIFMAYSRAQKLPLKFAQYNTIKRLLDHKTPIVGGVYAARRKAGNLVIQPELQPRNPQESRVAQAIRDGKDAGGLQKVDWLAAGLMLVHRTVFERIMEREPIKAETYPFFVPENAIDGEDIAFCRRAIRAGFQPLLDTEIRAGHIGLGMWMPEDTVPVKMGGK